MITKNQFFMMLDRVGLLLNKRITKEVANAIYDKLNSCKHLTLVDDEVLLHTENRLIEKDIYINYPVILAQLKDSIKTCNQINITQPQINPDGVKNIKKIISNIWKE